MEISLLKRELEKIIIKECIYFNEPMKNHTSFKVGGPADILVLPSETSEVIELLNFCNKYNIDFYIMGNGSNTVVRDKGFRGMIIKLTELSSISIKETTVTAGAGAFLSCVAKAALNENLKGMEFASGIPGTVGGAVAMNAGAYGPEIKDIIDYADVVDLYGNVMRLSRDELELSYRNSIVQKNDYIVLQAAFKLEPGNYEDIKNRMDELNRRRADKQPLNYPSAGSTFKRPEGYFAAKLIEDSGLKGLSCGGAMVSEKHSGFIINFDNATTKDILKLIEMVQKAVYDKFNVFIEPEIKIIGEND
jgi:UDP-N-acetylmuramate dehydrogenase